MDRKIMNFKLLRNPEVRYESIWLRILVAFLVAQFIVFVGYPKINAHLFTTYSYFRAVSVSFLIGIIVLQWVYLQTVYLDHKQPWARDPKKRRRKQIIYGVAVPILIDFIGMAILWGVNGINIFYTRWPTLYFPVILFMLGLLNFYYYNRYKISESRNQKEKAIKIRSLAHRAETSVQRMIKDTEEVLYYYKAERKIMALLSTGEKIITLFGAITDIDISDGKLMQPDRFSLVAWSNICKVEKAGRHYIITLRLPENTSIMLSRQLSALYRKQLNSML